MKPTEHDAADNGLSALIKTQASRYEAPADLRANIRAAISPARTASPFWWQRLQWPQVAQLGGAFACGILVSLALTRLIPQLDAPDRMAEEVVASHVRSMMVAHLSDVVSTDQHTVKPWFAGKLDFSPPVHDLAKDGFELVGGRLDYIGRRPVAAMVYRRNQHVINVFIWPVSTESPIRPPQSRQGFNITGWADAGMQFWAVSDISADELKTFAQLLRDKKQ
jgi:anti-sigma factor RsiW